MEATTNPNLLSSCRLVVGFTLPRGGRCRILSVEQISHTSGARYVTGSLDQSKVFKVNELGIDKLTQVPAEEVTCLS